MVRGKGRWVAVALAIGLLALAGLAACGGDSGGGAEAEAEPTTTSEPVDAATQVLSCIEERGGEEWPLSPIMPDDAPAELETVYAIGPDRGHIGVIMSLEPALGRRLAKELEEIAEYRAIPIKGGREVLIYDPGLSVPDKSTIYDCSGAV